MTLNPKIAITGSNGYVSRHLRKFFHEKKIPILAIARKNFQTYDLEKKIISKDYSSENILPSLKNCDTLIHLVSTTLQSVKKNHVSSTVEITKKIVNLCKESKIKKIIYLSGLGASKNTTSGYFLAKFLAEQEIQNSNIDFTIFRPSDILGYDDYMFENFKKQMKLGFVLLPGSGKYLFQPIFVDDVSRIIFEAINKKKYKNRILDLVGPEKITFEKYIQLFFKNGDVNVKKIGLEQAYYNALHSSNVSYGVDDLNMLIGSFSADFKKLQKFSGLKFTHLKDYLQIS